MARASHAVAQGRRRSSLALRGASAALAVFGYILSPLSWWNDAFVNIPLSLALAGALYKLAGVDPKIGFAASYWFTNVAGLVLMLLGGHAAYKGRVTAKSIAASLAAGTAYTLAVIGLLDLLGW